MTSDQLTSLSLLSQPTNWRLIETLSQNSEPMTPTLLALKLKLPYNSVSHHLNRLLGGDLVLYVPSGVSKLYLLNRETLRELLKEIEKITPKHKE